MRQERRADETICDVPLEILVSTIDKSKSRKRDIGKLNRGFAYACFKSSNGAQATKVQLEYFPPNSFAQSNRVIRCGHPSRMHDQCQQLSSSLGGVCSCGLETERLRNESLSFKLLRLRTGLEPILNASWCRESLPRVTPCLVKTWECLLFFCVQHEKPPNRTPGVCVDQSCSNYACTLGRCHYTPQRVAPLKHMNHSDWMRLVCSPHIY